MPRDSLVGSRIRERRVMAGLRQADLAKSVGISPSYLNLIEHNKRRIGGKLLVDIAQELEVEPSLLSEGAEAALIATLREAAADVPRAEPELDRVDEFAGRFPGWARLISEGHQQILKLEHTVETLTDRLAHDPHLATSMHEVLSMVTAIRSTAGILFENTELEPEWRGRFHRNLNEDSQRLAESSQALVSYLDGAGDAEASVTSPQDEVDNFLRSHSYHFPSLEYEGANIENILDRSDEISSAAARDVARKVLVQYQKDALRMPLDDLRGQIAETGVQPAALAQRYQVSLATAMRRCAVLPDDVLPHPIGLVTCDGSGTLLFRREVEGFPLPRFSAACPKWPLFQALSRPMQPIREIVDIAGRDAHQFECLAISEPVGQVSFERDALYHAHMLILPTSGQIGDVRPIGATCRICARQACDGRREPSILLDGI